MRHRPSNRTVAIQSVTIAFGCGAVMMRIGVREGRAYFRKKCIPGLRTTRHVGRTEVLSHDNVIGIVDCGRASTP